MGTDDRTTVNRRAGRRGRRAFAIGMALSLLTHVAVLALVELEISLWPGAEDRAGQMASVDRYMAQRPLEVVQVRAAENVREAEAAAAPDAAGSSPAAPAAASSVRLASPDVRRRAGAESTTLALTPVERHPAEAVAVLGVEPGTEEAAGPDLNRGIVFVGANEAARLARRDLERAARSGRLEEVSRRSGGGISISIVGAGGNCDTPSTGVIDRFVGNF